MTKEELDNMRSEFESLKDQETEIRSKTSKYSCAYSNAVSEWAKEFINEIDSEMATKLFELLKDSGKVREGLREA